jgi:hypothetical protein
MNRSRPYEDLLLIILQLISGYGFGAVDLNADWKHHYIAGRL